MSTEKKSDPEQLQVPLVYVGIDEAPIEFLNQFIIQAQGNEFILTLGAVAPPLILSDDPEERRRLAEAVRFVPVHVLGRYALTAQRLDEFVQILTRFSKAHNAGEKAK